MLHGKIIWSQVWWGPPANPSTWAVEAGGCGIEGKPSYTVSLRPAQAPCSPSQKMGGGGGGGANLDYRYCVCTAHVHVHVSFTQFPTEIGRSVHSHKHLSSRDCIGTFSFQSLEDFKTKNLLLILRYTVCAQVLSSKIAILIGQFVPIAYFSECLEMVDYGPLMQRDSAQGTRVDTQGSLLQRHTLKVRIESKPLVLTTTLSDAPISDVTHFQK